MKKKNLRSVTVRRFKQTMNSNHSYGIVENKRSQNFITTAHNKVWVSNITYISTKQGWAYLTSVIDLFDRKVIGWKFSHSLKAKDTVIPALNRACSARLILIE